MPLHIRNLTFESHILDRAQTSVRIWINYGRFLPNSQPSSSFSGLEHKPQTMRLHFNGYSIVQKSPAPSSRLQGRTAGWRNRKRAQVPNGADYRCGGRIWMLSELKAMLDKSAPLLDCWALLTNFWLRISKFLLRNFRMLAVALGDQSLNSKSWTYETHEFNSFRQDQPV